MTSFWRQNNVKVKYIYIACRKCIWCYYDLTFCPIFFLKRQFAFFSWWTTRPQQIWFNLDQAKQNYGGKGSWFCPPGWECNKLPRWRLSVSCMSRTSYGCNDHRCSYFTRNICNWYVDSLETFFGASSEACSVIVMTIRRPGLSQHLTLVPRPHIKVFVRRLRCFFIWLRPPTSNCYLLHVAPVSHSAYEIQWSSLMILWSYGSEINVVVNSCIQFYLWIWNICCNGIFPF